MPEEKTTAAGSWLGDLTNEWKTAKPQEKILIVVGVIAVAGIAFYLYKKQQGGQSQTITSPAGETGQPAGSGPAAPPPNVPPGSTGTPPSGTPPPDTGIPPIPTLTGTGTPGNKPPPTKHHHKHHTHNTSTTTNTAADSSHRRKHMPVKVIHGEKESTASLNRKKRVTPSTPSPLRPH